MFSGGGLVLIGLSGVAGSGKDTVAGILVEKHGFKRYAFADAVKDAADSIGELVWLPYFNRSLADIRKHLTWDELKRSPELPECRRLLQLVGTELGRQVLGDDCWVNIVERKWKSDGCPDAVITDLRFENEQYFVEDEGGYVIELIRPDNPDAIPADHASEQFKPTPFMVLVNEALVDLDENVASMLRTLQADEASYGS